MRYIQQWKRINYWYIQQHGWISKIIMLSRVQNSIYCLILLMCSSKIYKIIYRNSKHISNCLGLGVRGGKDLTMKGYKGILGSDTNIFSLDCAGGYTAYKFAKVH